MQSIHGAGRSPSSLNELTRSVRYEKKRGEMAVMDESRALGRNRTRASRTRPIEYETLVTPAYEAPKTPKPNGSAPWGRPSRSAAS